MGVKVDFYKEEPAKSVCETIRVARQKMGYTQAYVAECIQMSTRQYVKYEHGTLDIGEISFQQGVNLCELLHLDVYELIAPISKILEDNKHSA